MKKSVVLLFLAIGLLSGCQNPTTSENESSKESTSMTTTSSTIEIPIEESATVETSTEISTTEETVEQEPTWNEEKEKALADFMAVWEKSMNQQYQSYGPEHPVDLYGVLLPNAILPTGDWKMVVDNQPVSVIWSEDGLSSESYQLIAVYSDIEHSQQEYAFDMHTYFFMIVEGQPKVFITQQSQGNSDNYLYFSETQNGELRQGFADIFETGQTSLTNSLEPATSEESNASSITDINSAYEYLKEKDENNPDFLYSDMGEGTDGYGHYWELKVTSKSMREGGGTGTLARVKVYEDGVLRDAISGDIME